MTTITEGDARLLARDRLLAKAGHIEQLVGLLHGKLRELYHRAVLFLKPCPRCAKPDLTMLRDSLCRCRTCDHEFDPTEAFQVCPDCGGALRRKIHHYWCTSCRQRVRSLYCFDAKVFDVAYFREMMRQSRERKRERVERLRKLLAGSRSGPLVDLGEPELGSVPGLTEDLATFVNGPIRIPDDFALGRDAFDLDAYKEHIRELVGGCVVHFDGIGPLIHDRRLDRVYRFITVIFMAQAGEVSLLQDSPKAEIILEGRG